MLTLGIRRTCKILTYTKLVWSSFSHCYSSLKNFQSCVQGGPNWALLGPKMAKHGRLAGPKMVVNGPNGPKWSIQYLFDHLGPFRTYLGSFGSLALRSMRVTSRSVRVTSRFDRRLPRSPWRLPQGLIAGCLEVSCAGRLEVPVNKLWDQNFQFQVFFWPFRPKRASSRPITIQIMRFGQNNFFLW